MTTRLRNSCRASPSAAGQSAGTSRRAAAIEACQLIGGAVEGQQVQRPALDDGGRLLERAVEAQPQVGTERRLRRLADVLDAPAHAGDRARGERETVLFEIRERIERRLRVARPGERARQIASLVAQAPGRFPDERLEQAQQRPPALHRPAEIMHRLGVGFRRVVDRRVRLGEDVAGHRAQRLPHRHARPQGGPLVHAGGLYRYCSTTG